MASLDKTIIKEGMDNERCLKEKYLLANMEVVLAKEESFWKKKHPQSSIQKCMIVIAQRLVNIASKNNIMTICI